MTVENCFEVPEGKRNAFIDSNIVGKLKEEDREKAKKEALQLQQLAVAGGQNFRSVVGY